MIGQSIMTPAQKRAKAKYDENNTIQVKLKLNLNTDKDIIEVLEQSGNKQGYIKDLIRHSTKEQKKKGEKQWNNIKTRNTKEF